MEREWTAVQGKEKERKREVSEKESKLGYMRNNK